MRFSKELGHELGIQVGRTVAMARGHISFFSFGASFFASTNSVVIPCIAIPSLHQGEGEEGSMSGSMNHMRGCLDASLQSLTAFLQGEAKLVANPT
jgi:hypothetical protein